MLLLPFAGTGTVVYRSWLSSIPGSIEPWAMLLPGRESRMAEQPLTRMQDVVQQVMSGIECMLGKPYIIFGHSMGAMTAFEVCRALRGRQEQLPAHLVVSGRRAPHMPPRRRPLHGLPDPELIEELRRYNGTPEAILRDRDLMELMLPVIRSDLTVVETYEYQEAPPLDVPLAVFGGDSDADADLSELQGWARHTTSSFELTVMQGDHFYLLRRHASLMEAIVRLVG